MATLSRVQHAGLIGAFSQLFEPLDVLLVDTAAGLSDGVITFSEAAQRVVVLVCDEPASLTDAYGLIKVLEPAATELPVRNRREHGRLRRRKGASSTRSSCASAIGSWASRRPISATCRTTTTCARRFAAKRRSSKRFRAAPRRARSTASPAPSTVGKSPAQARGGVEFFMDRLVHGRIGALRGGRAMTPGYKTAVSGRSTAGRRARAAARRARQAHRLSRRESACRRISRSTT